MPGVKELRSIRLRREATNGTLVVPRFFYRGVGSMPEDQTEVTMVEEQVGIFNGTDRSYVAKLGAKIKLDEAPATYETVADLLMMAGLGTYTAPTGSAQGVSGSTVAFLLPIPTDTQFATNSYTLEAGENAVEAEKIPYVVADELKFTFPQAEAVKVEASLMGQYVARTNALGTFNQVGTLIPVETILSRGSVFLTPVGSGFGTGQVTAGNILSGNVTFKPKWVPKQPIDAGTIYYSTAVFTDMEITGELVFEHQISGTFGAAGTSGQKEKWRTQTPQLMRLDFPGTTITAGTTYTTTLLRFDLPFKYTKFSNLDDQDGNSIVTASWVSQYNESTPTAGRGTVWVIRRGTSEFSGAN